MPNKAAIILAAGQGTRMRSKLVKVLHCIAGTPMIGHVLKNVKKAGFDEVHVVLGHQKDKVIECLPDISCVEQREQLGTGHAVLQCHKVLQGFSGPVLVTYGDTPLFRPETYEKLAKHHCQTKATATILTAIVDDPAGYGRVIRNHNGHVKEVIEDKDATIEQKAVKEINTGTYCFQGDLLFQYLKQVTPHNAQGEYYLPDIIPMLIRDGYLVSGFVLDDVSEAMGVNDRVQLACAEKIISKRICEKHMREGVTIIDPETTFISEDCQIGQDSIIYPLTFLQKGSVIGEDCEIGPNVRIWDSSLGNSVTVTNSVLLSCKIHDHVTIGPFAYIRPGTEVGSHSKIGDFVEVKNSKVDSNSKIPHHAYVGDAIIGKEVNVGCGVITCNYDGQIKHQTVIGDNCFVGSNSSLVAPVQIGNGAYIGAGSTITEDVPPNSLAIGRARQVNKEGWTKRRVKGDHQSK